MKSGAVHIISLSPLGLCWDLCVDCSTDWWKCWANSSALRLSQGRDLLWSVRPLSPWGRSFSCGRGGLELFCRLGALLIGGPSPKRDWSCSGASGGGSLGREWSESCESLWRSAWLTLWRCLVGPGGVTLREFGWGSPFVWQGVEGVVWSEADKYHTIRKRESDTVYTVFNLLKLLHIYHKWCNLKCREITTLQSKHYIS